MIRSSRRKMRQDRQQRLTKFFSLKTTPNKSSKTTTSSTLPTIKMIQPSIITFLSKKSKEVERAKSAINRSNNSRLEYTIVTTNNNPTHQQLQPEMPIEPIKTNPTKIYKETIPKESRQTHQTTSLNLNNNRQHQIVINPYLQSIIQLNQKPIYHEQFLTQPIVSQSPDPISNVTTPSATIQNTTPNTYSNLHRQRILTKEGSILINGNNNIITEESEVNINNNTIPFLQSKPSTPVRTYRKYPIKPTTRLPGCNGSRDVTQNNNQPHQNE